MCGYVSIIKSIYATNELMPKQNTMKNYNNIQANRCVYRDSQSVKRFCVADSCTILRFLQIHTYVIDKYDRETSVSPNPSYISAVLRKETR